MAFTAVGALIAGETAVTATMVLSAVAEVGMAMTVVGAVTGSKDLMKIGGVLGLIGGVGGMIAGGLSGAASTAATAATDGVNLGSVTGSAMDAATSMGDVASLGAESAATSAVSTPSVLGDALPDLGGAMPNPTDMRLAAGSQTTPQGVIASEMQPQAAATVNDVNSPLGAQGPAGAQAPQGPVTPADTNPTDIRLAGGTQTSPAAAPQSSGSFWKSFSNFADKNKTLFSSGLQLVGGAMKGANDRDMWNQKMAIDQQRVNQTSYGSQVGNFAPQGIINGARAA